MRHLAALFIAMALLPTSTLGAQTPAPAVRPRAAARMPAKGITADSQARFTAIRERYRKEMDTERTALRRTHDRMRAELTAAGWRGPRRGRMQQRNRFANFRRAHFERNRMHQGRWFGRRAMMMRRGPSMAGPRNGFGGSAAMRRGPGGFRPGGRGPGGMAMGRRRSDSTAARSAPPAPVKPDSK